MREGLLQFVFTFTAICWPLHRSRYTPLEKLLTLHRSRYTLVENLLKRKKWHFQQGWPPMSFDRQFFEICLTENTFSKGVEGQVGLALCWRPIQQAELSAWKFPPSKPSNLWVGFLVRDSRPPPPYCEPTEAPLQASRWNLLLAGSLCEWNVLPLHEPFIWSECEFLTV